MERINSRYENASVVIAGAACLPILVSWLHLPGFRYLTVLSYMVFSAWIGLLLGSMIKRRRWWMLVLILSVAFVGMIYYRQVMDHGYMLIHTVTPFLMSAGLGCLFSLGWVRTAEGQKGWEFLFLLLTITFCWVAISVIHERLVSGMWIPEHQDMERLMENLSADAEILLFFPLMYSLVMFAFSKTGLWLGRQSWFRGIVLVPVVLSFVSAAGRIGYYWREQFLIPFLVQPLTVWLMISIVHWVMDRK